MTSVGAGWKGERARHRECWREGAERSSSERRREKKREGGTPPPLALPAPLPQQAPALERAPPPCPQTAAAPAKGWRGAFSATPPQPQPESSPSSSPSGSSPNTAGTAPPSYPNSGLLQEQRISLETALSIGLSCCGCRTLPHNAFSVLGPLQTDTPDLLSLRWGLNHSTANL